MQCFVLTSLICMKNVMFCPQRQGDHKVKGCKTSKGEKYVLLIKWLVIHPFSAFKRGKSLLSICYL